ncbi:MAG: glycosyltransferase family 39 protein [Candidatus Hydrogenedentes bacterium]|nr:glycosyltransferase family 39 protein [Candidatus Hydrogenedentota bacterium]
MDTQDSQNATPRGSRESSSRGKLAFQILSVILVLLVAVLLRVYRIQDESLSRDELACANHLLQPGLIQYMISRAHDDPPEVLPLYFVAQYYWSNIVGPSPLAWRILPLASSLLTLLLLYDFGRRLQGHVAGLVTMLCASCSKLLIFESQELRMYGFTFFFGVLSVYALYRALYEGPRWWWGVHAVASACMAWTHILSLPLLVVFGVFLLATKWREFGLIVRWGIAAAVPVLAIPLYVLTAKETPPNDEMAWLPLPWRARFIDTFLYAFPGSKMDVFDPLAHAIGGVTAAIALAGVFALAGIWLVYRTVLAPPSDCPPDVRVRNREITLLLAIWLVLPPALLYVTSYIVRPCYIERYVYLAAFASYLGVGSAIALIPSRGLRAAAVTLLACLYALLCTDLVRPLRPDFLNGIAYVNENASPSDAFAATDINSRIPVNYYLKHGASPVVSPEEFPEHLIKAVNEGKQAWGVFYAEYPINAQEFEKKLQENGIASEVRVFPGWQDLRVYKLNRATVAPAG